MSTQIAQTQQKSPNELFANIPEPGPQHEFRVWFSEIPGSEETCIVVDAFDAFAAAAKVMTLYSQVRGEGPVAKLDVRVEADAPDSIFSCCDECQAAKPDVKRFGDTFICDACQQGILDDLVARGWLESRERPDGRIEYRATEVGRQERLARSRDPDA